VASDGGARTRPGSAPATENGQRPRAWSAPVHAAYLTGHAFLPALIAAPFSRGLDIAFDFAIAACLVAALASLLRGRRYVHEEHGPAAGQATGPGQPVTTWKVASVGSAAYAIRPPSAITSRRAATASAVMSSPGASTGTPGG